jgi:hypothetical protein
LDEDVELFLAVCKETMLCAALDAGEDWICTEREKLNAHHLRGRPLA